MLTAEKVAAYFLTKSDPEVGDVISNLKLQKLCYYAQGFNLAVHDRPLFADRIEAWRHGPVVPSVYYKFSKYGSAGIPVPENINFADIDADTAGLLDEIFDVYGQFSAWKLRNMTHEEQPWLDVWDPEQGSAEITHESLKRFFKGRLNG